MDDKIVRLVELEDRATLLPSTSEEALALAFAHRHEHELRYVAAWARWLSCDGTRWEPDDTLHAFDRARDICREEALACEKPASAVKRRDCAFGARDSFLELSDRGRVLSAQDSQNAFRL